MDPQDKKKMDLYSDPTLQKTGSGSDSKDDLAKNSDETC